MVTDIKKNNFFLRSLLKLYKTVFSPFLGTNCRFHPSCSEYAVLAIERKGYVKGFALSLFRFVKCNPWYQGKDIDLEDNYKIVSKP